MTGVLETYWRGVAQRLQVEADAFNAIIQHNGEVGRANEGSLSELLKNLLPQSVAVGTGLLFNRNNHQSPQTDLIVYSIMDQPRLLSQTTQVLFPVETVPLAIEVKTTLTPAEVDNTAGKFEEIRKLYKEVDLPSPHLSLFAYTCGANHPVTLLSRLKDLPNDRRPDSLCILRPAAFGGGETFGLVPLHRVDNATGEQLSRQWVEPARGEEQDRFPAVRREPRQSGKVATEPGRALLLYADALLTALALRDYTKNVWLSKYLPVTAQELLEIN